MEGPMTDCSTIVIGAAREPEEISSDKSFASLAVKPVITKVRGKAVLIVAMTDQALLFIELNFFDFVTLPIKRSDRPGFGFNEQDIHIAAHVLSRSRVDLIAP